MKKLHPEKYALPEVPGYNPKKDRSYRFILLSLICFFVGFGLCVAFYSLTLITILDFSKFIAGFAVAGFLVPLKFYHKWFHFIKYEMIIFNIMGIAPILSGLFLVLNFTFSTNPYTHDYKIEKIYFEGENNFRTIGVVLEDNFFSGERKIVELSDAETNTVFDHGFFRVTISEGLFGFDVIKDRVFIR